MIAPRELETKVVDFFEMGSFSAIHMIICSGDVCEDHISCECISTWIRGGSDTFAGIGLILPYIQDPSPV